MKLPLYKRIFKTDFAQEYQGLVEQLSASLNSGIETLYDLTNKKISLRDNVACTVKDFDVMVNAAGIPMATTSVSLDVPGRVDGISVIRCDNLKNSAVYPTGQPFITFTQTGQAVIVSQIAGLQSGQMWRLRVIVWQA